ADAHLEVTENGIGAPVTQPVCANGESTAYAGYRLASVVDAFGERGTSASICSNDFASVLSNIGTSFRSFVVRQLEHESGSGQESSGCAVGGHGSPEGLAALLLVLALAVATRAARRPG